MPTWRSDASASHTPSRQSLLDEKSVSSRSGTFWFSSSAHLVVDSSGSLPLLSLPHSAVRNFCTDAFFLGWQAYLEEDILKHRERGSGVLAEMKVLEPPHAER